MRVLIAEAKYRLTKDSAWMKWGPRDIMVTESRTRADEWARERNELSDGTSAYRVRAYVPEVSSKAKGKRAKGSK